MSGSITLSASSAGPAPLVLSGASLQRSNGEDSGLLAVGHEPCAVSVIAQQQNSMRLWAVVSIHA